MPPSSFKVNTGFKSKSKVIRTPMPSLEEAKTKERVGEERSQVVDAAVVRVMKARKQLSIKDLEMEVLRQLQHFSPTPRLIKVRCCDWGRGGPSLTAVYTRAAPHRGPGGARVLGACE